MEGGKQSLREDEGVMSLLAKVFIVVNLVLAIVFFSTSATLYTTRSNWREVAEKVDINAKAELSKVRKEIEGQAAMLQEYAKRLSKLDADYNTVSTDKQKKDVEITEVKGKLEKANLRIDTEVKDRTQLTVTLQDIQAKKADLDKLVDSLRKETDEAKASRELATNEMTRIRVDLERANNEHSKLLIEHEQTLQKNQTMEIQLAAVKERVGTGILDIGVPPIDAVIQAVGKAEDKIVVLSVGRGDKVEEGFEFTVFRGDRFVGKVKVIKVYDELSGARILYTQEGEAIQQGDKAATHL